MNRQRDAVIVGAGPAGSTLALLLAREGLDVLLLDRCAFPREKPCGDCLSPQAARILARIGALPAVHAASPAVLSGWRIVAPSGRSFSARFCDLPHASDAPALALPRQRLDALLLDLARNAGAEVRTGVSVHDLVPHGVIARLPAGGTESLRARLVVGADGLRSRVARRMGALRRPPRLRKLSLTAHITGAVHPERMGEMHVGRDACAGIAPVGRDYGNLTLVLRADVFGRAVAEDAWRTFVRVLHSFPRLGLRLRDARVGNVSLRDESPSCRPRLLASGPFDAPTRAIVHDGIALVGDAAGYFDPFTGQGICQALAGAELLAEEALEAFAAGDTSGRRLRRYERRLRAMTGAARLVQRGIETVLSHSRLADAAIARLARAPAAAHAILAVTGDLAPASSLLSPLPLLSFAVPRISRSFLP